MYDDILNLANKAFKRLATNDSIVLREQIAETAQETGGLSIWLEVFATDVDMCRLLLKTCKF